MKPFSFRFAARPAFAVGIAVAAMALYLTACGNGEHAPAKVDASSNAGTSAAASEAASAKIDACELFPVDEASEVAGENVSWMSSTLEDAVGRDLLTCAYNAGSTENPRILSLIVRPAPSPERAQRMHKATRSSFKTMARDEVREIPNLGESAFWAGGDIHQLRALAGAYELAVTVNLGAERDGSAAAESIARKALERLAALPKSPAP